MNWTLGISNDWFMSGYAEKRSVTRHHAVRQRQRRRDQPVQPQARPPRLRSGPALGQFGELRLGLLALIERTTPDVEPSTLSSVDGPVTLRERGIRLGAVIDQLDFANFPTRGYRLESELDRRPPRPQRLRPAHRLHACRGLRHRRAELGPALAQCARARRGAPARTTAPRWAATRWAASTSCRRPRSEQLDGNAVVSAPDLVPALADRTGVLRAASSSAPRWRPATPGRAGAMRAGRPAQRHEPVLGAVSASRPLYFRLTTRREVLAGLYLFVGRP